MRWILPSVLLVFSSLACSIGVVPPTPVADVPTATLPAVAAPPTEQPPTPVSLTTAPPPPPPTATPAPTPADQSPPPPTPTPTIPGLWLEDDFENPDNDGDFDRGLWFQYDPTTVEQNDGVLMLSRQSPDNGGLDHGPLKIDEISFVETKVRLDEKIEASVGSVSIQFSGSDWWLDCSIARGRQDSKAWANCNTSDGTWGKEVIVEYNSWHTLRIEVNPATAVLFFFVGDAQIGSYTSPNPEAFKQTQVNVGLRVWSEDGGLVTGYFDDVRVGKAQAGESAVDPALYDDFNDEEYEEAFNPEKWATTVEQPSGQIEQQEGKLILSFIPGTDITSIGIATDEPFKLNELGFMEAEIYLSDETAKEGGGEISTGLYTPLNNSQDLVFSCSIYKSGPSAEVGCEVWVFDKSNSNSTYQPEYVSEKKPTSFDTPHIVRIEVDPEVNVAFYVDDQPIGSHKPNNAAEVKGKDSKPTLWIVRNNQSGLTAYVDDVRIGRLGQ